MRTALATALLAALLCGGCKKPQGPQTTEPTAPTKTAGPLKPLEPPTSDLAPGPDRPMIAPKPVHKPEPLVTPDRPVTPVAPRPVEPASPRTYVVEKGDTLWKIATKVYGDGQRYRDILAANPGIEASKLKVGQKLVIPAK